MATQLWFGDERGYNATFNNGSTTAGKLWFGDERGYNATNQRKVHEILGCGLVMKEDITQLGLKQIIGIAVVVW